MSSPFAPPGPVPPQHPPHGSPPPLYGYAPPTFSPPTGPGQGGRLGAPYRGSPYLPPRVPPYAPVPARRPNRIWIPIACIALVLVLAIGVGFARLVGTVVDAAAPGGIGDRAARTGLTFDDPDEVVTVSTSTGWWDNSPAEAGQIDSDGLYLPSLVVVDGVTTIVVWIFPTIPAGELADAHAANVDDGCAERSCGTRGSASSIRVDDHPALSSTVTTTDDDEDLIAVVTTVIAPRHLVLIQVEGYAEASVPPI